MAKNKVSVSPVRDLAALFDLTVDEWRSVVTTIRKYRKMSLGKVEAELRKIVEASASSATAEVDAHEAERVVGLRLADHLKLVSAVLNVLDGKVPASVAPALTATVVPEGKVDEGFLKRVATLINFRGQTLSAEAIYATLEGWLDDHPLLESGKFAMRMLREMMASYLKIDSEGMNTKELQDQFEEMLKSNFDLLNWLIQKITKKDDASDDEVREALDVLLEAASKPVPTPVPANGAGEVWKLVAQKIGFQGDPTKQKVMEALEKVALAADRIPALEEAAKSNSEIQALVAAAQKFTGKEKIADVTAAFADLGGGNVTV